MKRISIKYYLFILTCLFVFHGVIRAQIPDGYYDDAIGLTGDELKSALHNIIKDHQEYSYNDLRDFILEDTDEDPDNPDNVILIHSGISRPKSQFGGNTGDWNREHVWAKSHGDFGTVPPAGTDAHHIRPSDVQVNGTRGNLDFDDGGNPVNNCPGCKVDGDSFETRDGAKGDVARMIFYMAVRYEGDNGEPDLEVVDEVNTYPNPEHGKLSTLLSWHSQDTVDDFEMNRNDVIYGYQHNRNPFIDHPEFVEDIWGDPTKVNSTFELSVSCYPNPAHDKLYIEQSLSKSLSYSLVDMKGNRLENGIVNPGISSIDVSEMIPGLYVLLLTDRHGDHIKQYKLLKTSN
jgi:endonuclease I